MTKEMPVHDLEDVIELYPLLFTQKRLDEWLQLFDKRAVVVRIEAGQPVACQNIHDAMPEQREYAAENSLFEEKWEQVRIHQYGNLAVIRANYTLTVDSETRKGFDVLTLCRTNEEWKIIHLAYEQQEYSRR